MAMLQSTLDQLRARLEAALQISDPRDEKWVALTNPVDLDGSVSESARNKIVMRLAGLQSDPTVGNFPATNFRSRRAGHAATASERFRAVAGQFHRQRLPNRAAHDLAHHCLPPPK